MVKNIEWDEMNAHQAPVLRRVRPVELLRSLQTIVEQSDDELTPIIVNDSS
jgi:hypothetical protein